MRSKRLDDTMLELYGDQANPGSLWDQHAPFKGQGSLTRIAASTRKSQEALGLILQFNLNFLRSESCIHKH
jgi:hypothetical protein